MSKESIEKIQKRIEQSSAEVLDFEIKDEIGSISVVETKDRDDLLITLENDKGEKFEINSLLPSEYKFREGWETLIDSKKKEIFIGMSEFKDEQWKYILSILHEIGHVVRQKQKPEEVKELDKLCAKGKAIWKDPKLFERYMELHSDDERDAWALAIRQLKVLSKDFNPKLKDIFPDLQSFTSYIEEWLDGYKTSHSEIVECGFDDKQREKLLDALTELYVKDKRAEVEKEKVAGGKATEGPEPVEGKGK